MAALCREHNLVVGSDGKCVICRRPSGAILVYGDEPESVFSRVLTLALLGCIALGLTQLVKLWAAPQDQGARFVLVGDGKDHSRGPVIASDAVPVAAPADAGKPVDDALDQVTAQAAADAPTHLKRERERTKLREALAKVKVTMYATSWCYVCDRANDMLAGREVPVQILDIEADDAARRRLLRLNPSGTVPTFQVEGQTIVGFDPWILQEAVDEAAGRHLAQR